MLSKTDPTRASGVRRRRPDPEARRREILEVAADVFLEHGYEAGAMSEVARRLGGSKETLYRYFANKRALFAAVVEEGAARHGRGVFSKVGESGDLALDLGRLGRALLTFVGSEEHLALRRAVIAEAGKSDLGKLYAAQGRKAALETVAARLAKAMDQGELRRADPWIAALQFRGLCQSGLYDLRLEGVVQALTPEEIACASDEAVDVFLRAYAVLSERRACDERAPWKCAAEQAPSGATRSSAAAPEPPVSPPT